MFDMTHIRQAQGQVALNSDISSEDKESVYTRNSTDQNKSSSSSASVPSKGNGENKEMLRTLRVLHEELGESQRALGDAVGKSEANEPMLKRLMGEGLQLRKLLAFGEEVHVTL
jgi:hypothetical protein